MTNHPHLFDLTETDCRYSGTNRDSKPPATVAASALGARLSFTLSLIRDRNFLSFVVIAICLYCIHVPAKVNLRLSSQKIYPA